MASNVATPKRPAPPEPSVKMVPTPVGPSSPSVPQHQQLAALAAPAVPTPVVPFVLVGGGIVVPPDSLAKHTAPTTTTHPPGHSQHAVAALPAVAAEVAVVPMAMAVGPVAAPASYCSSPYYAPGQPFQHQQHHHHLSAPELQAQQQELHVQQQKQLEQQQLQLQQLQSPVKIQEAIPGSKGAMRHVSPTGNPLVASSKAAMGALAKPWALSKAAMGGYLAATGTMALTARAATPGGGKTGAWVTSPYHEFCQIHRKLLPAGLSNAEREKKVGQMWRALPEAEKEKYKASLTKLPTCGRGGMRAWVPANMALAPPPAPAMARPLPARPLARRGAARDGTVPPPKCSYR